MKDPRDDTTPAGSETLDDEALDQVSGGVYRSTPKPTRLESDATDATVMNHEVREHIQFT